MFRQWYLKNKVFSVCLMATMLFVGILCIFYLRFAHAFIADIYHGSARHYNGLIQLQIVHPLSYYTVLVDRFFFVSVLCILILPFAFRRYGNDIVWLLLIIAGVSLRVFPDIVVPPQNPSNEMIYLYCAQDIAEGGTPYQGAFDHKGPLWYYFLAAIVRIFGMNIVALRIVVSLISFIAVFFVYLLSRRVFQGKARLVMPLAYGVFLALPYYWDHEVEIGPVMMIFLVPALLCCVDVCQERRYPKIRIFACAVLSAAAFFMKQTAVLLAGPLCAVLFIVLWQKRVSYRQLWENIFCYVSGIAVVCGIVVLDCMVKGNLGAFYRSFVLYNIGYLRLFPAGVGPRTSDFIVMQLQGTVFMKLVLAGSILVLFNRFWRKPGAFFVWLALGLMMVPLASFFVKQVAFPYYYFIIGLGCSMIIAAAYFLLPLSRRLRSGIVLVLIVVYALTGFNAQRFVAASKAYTSIKKSDIYHMAEYILANTSNKDTLFVTGGTLTVNIFLRRRAPTRYFFWGWYIYGRDTLLEGLDKKEFLRFFAESKPDYILSLARYDMPRTIEKLIHDCYLFQVRFGVWKLYSLRPEYAGKTGSR
ncbi:MAG TPA: glycosyltransferase family 39 protein [Candidatus Omnitrophota bacterium]|nr:glycosyltransferase family 39 protein [Candidatus Omnitrophota bacterium]HPT07144.1 glycosyltransferase family 39 protein [Candidatus Omnitrophota bacterium]